MLKNAYRRILLPGLVSLVFLAFSGCSSKPYDIKFDKIVYDFGTAMEGKDVQFAYVFRNTGNQKLVIENVQPACGCTIANDWDKEVLPGKKGKIPITFKTPHYNGEVTKVINITTNIPEQKQIELTLKGNVTIPIEINPYNTWLGEIEEDTKVLNSSFEIKNNLGGTLKILEVIPPDPGVKFSLTTIEEGQKYKIDYSLEAPFEGKERVEKKFIVKTDNKNYEFIYPTFYYFVAPPLRVFPDRIYIDPKVIQTLTNYDINIKSIMKAPIKIRDVKLHGGNGITLSVKENIKDKYYLVSLAIPAGFKFPENEKTYVTFWVENDPQKAKYSIPLEEIRQQY